MKTLWIAFVAVGVVMLATTAVEGHSYRIKHIAIGHPSAPPTEGTEGAVYLALANQGSKSDRLVRALTPIADQVFIRSGKGESSPDVAAILAADMVGYVATRMTQLGWPAWINGLSLPARGRQPSGRQELDRAAVTKNQRVPTRARVLAAEAWTFA